MKSVLRILLFPLAAVAGAHGTEVAPSTTLWKEGRFEVREYPALVLVETAKEDASGNGSFGRLFRYISGSNAAEKKIPMTAPVFMDGHDRAGRMAFVMPATFSADTTPAASDDRVVVKTESAGRFAVLRFGGFASAANEERAVRELRRLVGVHQLGTLGEPFFAYYDPPWTLPPFRRNEVLVRIAPESPLPKSAE